jgi:surface protein
MEETFRNCYEMTAYDLDGWDTAKVTSMRYMFGNNILEDGTTSGVTSHQSLHGKATSFIFGSGFVTSNVVSMERMFQRQNGLNSTNDDAFNAAIHNFDVSKVKDISYMFSDCHNISKLDLSNWDTSSVENMDAVFYRSIKLEDIDVTGKFSTDNTTSMWAMFDMWPENNVLKTLDVKNFDTSKVKNMAYMFSNNKALTTIYASTKFTVTQLPSGNAVKMDDYGSYNIPTDSLMFKDCPVLVGGCGTKWSDKRVVTKKYAWIDGREDNPNTGTDEGYFTNLDYSGLYARVYKKASNASYYVMRFEKGARYSGDDLVFVAEWLGDDGRGSGFLNKTMDGDIIVSEGHVTNKFEQAPWQVNGSYEGWYVKDDNASRRGETDSGDGISKVKDVIFTDAFCKKARPKDTSYWFWCFCQVQTMQNLDNLVTTNVTDMSHMFEWNYVVVYDNDTVNIDTSNVTNMTSMFRARKSNVKKIRFGEKFVTNKVTNMSYMFERCTGLPMLDLRTWDTSNVTNMTNMFNNCPSLKTIYASEKFDVTRVTSYANMFSGCSALVGGCGTSWASRTSHQTDKTYAWIDGRYINPTTNTGEGYFTNGDYPDLYARIYPNNEGKYTMYFEFGPYSFNGHDSDPVAEWKGSGTSGFINSTTVPWSSYGQKGNITKVVFTDNFTDLALPVSTANWFNGFTSVKEFENIKKLNTSKVTGMSYMFQDCSALWNLDVSGWDTSNVTNMASVFYRCSNIREINIGGWSSSSVTTVYRMFGYCGLLQTIYATDDFYAGDGVNKNETFIWDEGLTGGNCTVWDRGHHDGGTYVRIDKPGNPGLLTDVAYFNNVGSALIIRGENSSEYTLHIYAYNSPEYQSGKNAAGSNLIKNIPRFNFAGCGNGWRSQKGNITKVVFYNNDSLKPNTVNKWFENCTKLKDFDLDKNLNLSEATDMCGLFKNCQALTNIDVSYWDTSKVTNMASLFESCSSFIELDVSGLDTSKVTNMSSAFYYCSNLRELNIAGWSSASITTVYRMFGYSRLLQTIYATDDFNAGNGVNKNETFIWCDNLSGGNGTVWDRQHDGGTYVHIDKPGNPGFLTYVADKDKVGSALILRAEKSGEYELHIYTFNSESYTNDRDAAGSSLVKDIPKFNFAGRGNAWRGQKSGIIKVVFHDKGTLKPHTVNGWFENCTKLTGAFL